MNKIIVIGCPGSGKSTFSRRLGEMLNIEVVHLDILNWNADKTVVEGDVFLNRLEAAIQKESWIIDGNYGSTLEMRFKACDTVFFLDIPTRDCLAGIEARKGIERVDMPWVETEETDPEFIDFIMNYKHKNRPVVLDLISKYPEKVSIIFKSREEANAYLMSYI
ncbi:adenylate kinase [Macrococcus animalis]|uniref:adenylate kinase n=1 Tax=Macrococcus animalis TaxID=3395467 RepID=UPI0039BEBA7E